MHSLHMCASLPLRGWWKTVHPGMFRVFDPLKQSWVVQLEAQTEELASRWRGDGGVSAAPRVPRGQA